MFCVVANSTKRLVRCRFPLDIQGICAFRRAYYSNGIRSNEGPVQLYKSFLEKQVLKPDDSQVKVVNQLQSLYERLKDYDPKKISSKSHAVNTVTFSILFSFDLCKLRVRTGHGKPGKSWNLMISFSRPGKSWNLGVGHGKSWKMNADCPKLLV